jgi:2-methylaconitate cis-trans-isomerase PrpF
MRVEGTVVHQVARPPLPGRDRLRIANPYGVMDVRVRAEAGPVPAVSGVSVGRTARHILDGEVFVPARLLDPAQVAAASA